MLEIYEKRIDRADRERIERIEFFDEVEEWRLIQNHYWYAILVFCEFIVFDSVRFSTVVLHWRNPTMTY